MATDPAFASTPNNGAPVRLGSAETNLNTAAQASTIFTAGSNGSFIYEIDVQASTTSISPTTVAGLIYIFAFDGTNPWLRDVYTVNAVTASSTTAPYSFAKSYTTLFLKSGWSLKASQSIAGNANLLTVTVFGADI